MDEWKDWRAYAKAIAAFFTSAVPSAIGTAAVVGDVDSVIKVLVIAGAAVVGGLTGAVTVYHIPNSGNPKGGASA